MLRHEVMRSGESGVQLPVNFRRLIWNAQQIFKCRPHRQGPTGAPAALSHGVGLRLLSSEDRQGQGLYMLPRRYSIIKGMHSLRRSAM